MANESMYKELTSEDYLNEAKPYYTNLIPHFTAPGNTGYWELGCILDSMIDFLNIAGLYGIVPYDDGRQFLNNAATSYIQNQKQGEWYDDWGWWGNSTAKVFDPGFSELFGSDQDLIEKFKTICSQTFNFMKTGKTPYHAMDAPNYTGTTQAYNHVVDMAAKFPGTEWEQIKTDAEPYWNIGCWQGPMGQNIYNQNPLYQNLGPFQDSVINGLFYIFAQRTLNHGPGTQQDIDDMTTFYQNWMNFNSLPEGNKYKLFYTRDDTGAGLFRERVGVYKNGKEVNGYNANLVWTGDQGLMLCALTQLYYRQGGTQQQETLDVIKNVINGVFNYALGDINNTYTNIIIPWCNLNMPRTEQPGPAPGGDTGDYFSGTGIFMRGLLEASGIPEIKMLVETSGIQSVLNNTLKAVTDREIYMNYVFSGFPPVDEHRWFDDFNKMATLVTASRLLAD